MTTDHIAAAQVHAGDELIFRVRACCSGTTACSALDALSASNFITSPSSLMTRTRQRSCSWRHQSPW